MKHVIRQAFGVLVMTTANLIAFSQSPEESPQEQRQDTTQQKQIVTNPHWRPKEIRAYSTFVTSSQDQTMFHLNAGASAFNVLRGYVPGYSIDPRAPFVRSGGIRSSESAVVIDGLPFDNTIANHYNLNAFEFESISSVSSPNATSLYGAAAADGGLFLTSKTGRGYDKPTFEFNSYSTLNVSEKQTSSRFDVDRSDRWLFCNSAAYKQDFGAVDTRLSYRYRTFPFDSDDQTGHDRRHAVKLNTGFEQGEKFAARLVLDYAQDGYMLQPAPSPSRPLVESFEQDDDIFLANLNFRYSILRWLHLSSQHSLADVGTEQGQTGTYSWNSDFQQKKRTHNIYLSAEQKLGESFGVSVFAGFHADSYKNDRTMSGNLSGEEKHESTAEAFNAGVELNIAQSLYVDFTLRNEWSSYYPSERHTSWAASTAYLFNLGSNASTSGKLRANIGRMGNMYGRKFPDNTFNTHPDFLIPTERDYVEAGVDFTFFKDRLRTYWTYYKGVQKDLFAYSPEPFPTFYNIGEFHKKGIEALIGAVPVQTGSVKWESNVTFWAYEMKIDGGSTGGSSDLVIGNPVPDWNAGLLNRVFISGFFFSALIDVQHGGEIIDFDPGSGFIVRDASYSKLRDLSVGYTLRPAALHALNASRAMISISGRNLLQANDSENDPEAANQSGNYLKSVSLSLSVTF